MRAGCRSLAVALSAVLVVTACAGVASAAQPLVFSADPEASRITIELHRAGLLKFLGHDHTIAAPLAAGLIEADAGDLTRSSVRLGWEAARLAIVPGSEPAGDVPEVERRMRGPEVLDVAAHPDIAFASTAVSGRPAGPGSYRLEVRGVLTLKGQPHEIQVSLDARIEGDALVATGQTGLRLEDLGVKPPSVAGVVKVSNSFRVSFEIHARRRPAAGADQPTARR